jgi:toxin ParE1/3/4
VTREVVFAPEAQADLLDLYETIAREGGDDRALAYVERIQTACLRLEAFPERGTRRDHRPPFRAGAMARWATRGRPR